MTAVYLPRRRIRRWNCAAREVPFVRLITQTTSPTMARIQQLSAGSTGGQLLAPTLVVARTDPSPRSQVLSARKPTHIHADFTHQCRGRRGANPGNRLQEPAGFLVGLQINRDLLLDLAELLVDPVAMFEDLAQEQAMVRADSPLKGLTPVGNALPHAPPRVRGHLRSILLASDERLQHRPPTDA